MKAGEAGCGEAQELPDAQFSTSHEAPGGFQSPQLKDRSTLFHRAACWEWRQSCMLGGEVLLQLGS